MRGRSGLVRSRIHFLLSPRNTGSHRFHTRYKALPFYPPGPGRECDPPFCKKKTEASDWLLPQLIPFPASLRWHYPSQVIGRRYYLPLSLSYKLPSVLFSRLSYTVLVKNARGFGEEVENQNYWMGLSEAKRMKKWSIII